MRGYYRNLVRNVPETLLWLWVAKHVGGFHKDLVRLVADYFMDPDYELVQCKGILLWSHIQNRVYHALCTNQYVMYCAGPGYGKSTLAAGIIVTELLHETDSAGNIYFYTYTVRKARVQCELVRSLLPCGTLHSYNQETVALSCSARRRARFFSSNTLTYNRLGATPALIILDMAEVISVPFFEHRVLSLSKKTGCRVLVCINSERENNRAAQLKELCNFKVINH